MSDRDPLVSIVVPAYNHGQFLGEAIESVLAQDYARVELIVLDDGSWDNTREVLEHYGSRFYWESHANLGQAATLAKGWEMASGEILAYLSADDRLEPTAVRESVVALIEHPKAVATYCDFNLIDPASRVIRRVNAPDYDYRKMLIEVVCLPGPGAFFRRVAYKISGPWDATLRQMPDYDFWLRLGLVGHFIHIPRVLAEFRVHPQSQTYSQVAPDRAGEAVRIVSRLFDRAVLPPDMAQLRNEALANAELVSAQLHFRAGRFTDGWDAVRRALTLHPCLVYSMRIIHLLANAVINRMGHRVLWTINSLLRRGK